MQQKSLRVVLRQGGAWRVLALWYPTLVVGYPLVVLLLGHRLSEGWALVRENPRLPVLLAIMPLVLIAMGVIEYFLKRWLGDSDDRPAA